MARHPPCPATTAMSVASLAEVQATLGMAEKIAVIAAATAGEELAGELVERAGFELTELLAHRRTELGDSRFHTDGRPPRASGLMADPAG